MTGASQATDRLIPRALADCLSGGDQGCGRVITGLSKHIISDTPGLSRDAALTKTCME
jgi:hypothetical protein